MSRLRAIAAAATAAVVVLMPGAAGASFSATGSGTARVGAATLRNASGFTAMCVANTPNSGIDLAWVASPDAFVTSYEIVRSGTGGSVTMTAPANVTSFSDAPPTGAGNTYTYTIAARVQGWTTAASAGTTVSYTGGRGGNKCV